VTFFSRVKWLNVTNRMTESNQNHSKIDVIAKFQITADKMS